ncbi:MAG TPA: VWA domain-containing protein [bacterium]|nr:VWA domain-containing protein [bacterium]
MFRFADPAWLLLSLVIPLLIYWYIRRHRRLQSSLRYSNLDIIKLARHSPLKQYRHGLFALRLLALAALIIAMARPQAGSKSREVITEGIDIMLCMDVSTSMLAEDFQPHNRLEVSKLVAQDFIRGRANDRLGLVVFAGQSFTQCPLTLDYGILLKFMEQIQCGMVEDGTAIGNALANCVSRLRDSKAKSKVVILLTDGQNNRGEIDPITAARVAKAYKIRVYTIGAGTRGEALYPIMDPIWGKRYERRPVDIDENLLRQVAQITSGKYFRATDKTSLEKIYQEIGELEKTKIQVKEYTRYDERFVGYALAGLLLLLAEIVLANTRFRKLP